MLGDDGSAGFLMPHVWDQCADEVEVDRGGRRRNLWRVGKWPSCSLWKAG